ncbi:hypothetical protein [Sporosarcina sp. FSL K6-2383]|uniref:hypothetical protein n=1 Tax=Sporosarcina sp. FSL K6-2383 TaxID=2921556 RepID=UPI00315AA6C5
MKAIVSLVDGLPIKDPKAQIELTFDEERFIIVEKGFKGFKSIAATTFNIPLKNMLATVLTTEKELIEKNKSAIGRGVLGGVLFGPAGLILGGLSGIGKKSGSKQNYLYIISYVSSNEEIANITFGMPAMMNGVTGKFDKVLLKKLATIEPSELVKEFRGVDEQTEFNL